MGKKMQNAPIYYALAQVRFNAILSLEQYVPSIQDNLRKLGFPDYQRSTVARLNLSLLPASEPNLAPPPIQQSARHQFIDEACTSGFVLENASLVFHTTEYDTIKPFLDALIRALEIVNNAVGELSYCERLGMRCLDAVHPTKDDNLVDYLKPSVLGLLDKMPGRDLVHSLSETRTQAGKTTLVSRVSVVQQETKGAGYPPEFGPVPLKQKEKFAEISGRYAVIDTDCWIEDREKFDMQSIQKTLMSLHDEIRKSFDLMVTSHALKIWE